MSPYKSGTIPRRTAPVLIAALLLAVTLTACSSPAPAASSPAATLPPAATNAPAATEAPPATSAPAATEAPAATAAPAATDAPPATEAPAATEAPGQAPGQAPATAGTTVSYKEDLMPIFEKSCIRCHGGANGIEGELDQRTYAGLMKGGESGAVVVPGNSAGSLLYELIDAGKMPRRASRLPQEQIDLIARWIDEGALDN